MRSLESDASIIVRYAMVWQKLHAPALANFLASTGELPAADRLAICCYDLRQRIERNLPARAEDYLTLAGDTLSHDEIVLDLIYTEYRARTDRGEAIAPESVAQRFPPLAERILRLLDVDRAFGSDSTVDASATDDWPGSNQAVIEQTKVQTDVSRPDAKAHSTLPERIGRYPILRHLGRGGQGEVFQSMHPTLQIPVVIKWCRNEQTFDREQLLAEGRALASLNHPNLCRIFDLDFDGRRPFLVIEFLPGRTISQRIEESPVNPKDAARWTAKVARALEAVHQSGMIHRDIKPQNIILSADGEPKLLDFGLAKFRWAWNEENQENTGVISGSVGYMPPEQANGCDPEISARSDLFSLGATLHYLLTGKSPIPGSRLPEILSNAQKGHYHLALLNDPKIPKPLADLCRRCLASGPKDRPASAAVVADELERFAVGTNRSRRKWVVIGAGIALLTAGFGWFATNRRTPAPTPVLAVPFEETLSLMVNVRVGDRYVPLPNPAPVPSGRLVRIEGEAPPGQAAELITRDSTGRWRRLTESFTVDSSARFAFPRDIKRGIRIDGNGNELVAILIGESAVLSREVEILLANPPLPWPLLPLASVLSLEGTGVRVLQKTRDFTVVEDRANPEEEVAGKLEQLAQTMKEQQIRIRAIAFRSTR